ncbi:hypothetical protein [Streptomyces thermoalcalitolerans]|uniref:Uncharacterized protein n=1 Tax=Streptomyces thermoalcalitolerans TaxID=65605 RepID=A0ABN1PA28_9ACTN
MKKSRATVRTVANWAPPLVLTGISLGWSVYAIGDLLDDQAAAGLAYSAAGLYDAIWLYALYQEHEHRRQGSDGRTPQVLGWAFLVVSVGILFWHGWEASNLLAAIVGALIPVLSKLTLKMAADADAVRISPDAQRTIDAIRAGTRDRVAVARVTTWAKATGYTVDAALRRSEYAARGEAQRTHHEAHAAYVEVVTDNPVPALEGGEGGEGGTVPDDFGLITDEDLKAFLNGPQRVTVPDDETAGGTPHDAHEADGPARVPGTVDEKALALLAAEVYAALCTELPNEERPPSLRAFRARMRDEMRARGLRGSTALVDRLYRHEKALAGHGSTTGQEEG